MIMIGALHPAMHNACPKNEYYRLWVLKSGTLVTVLLEYIYSTLCPSISKAATHSNYIIIQLVILFYSEVAGTLVTIHILGRLNEYIML